MRSNNWFLLAGLCLLIAPSGKAAPSNSRRLRSEQENRIRIVGSGSPKCLDGSDQYFNNHKMIINLKNGKILSFKVIHSSVKPPECDDYYKWYIDRLRQFFSASNLSGRIGLTLAIKDQTFTFLVSDDKD